MWWKSKDMAKVIFSGASSPLGLQVIKDLSSEHSFLGLYNKNKIIYDVKNIDWLKVDFTSDFDEKKIISHIKNEKFLVLVCFAASAVDSLIVNTEYNDWKKVHEINAHSNFQLSKILLPKMIENRWGRIIHISSTRALNGDIGIGAYSSSKSALIGLSKTISKEYGRKNITSNVLSLGYFSSKLWDDLDSKIKNKLLSQVPSKKLGSYANISNAIDFLIKSDYVNGATINIDGGI